MRRGRDGWATRSLSRTTRASRRSSPTPAIWNDFEAERIVDELLRFAPISHTLLRVRTVDVEMHGVVIPAGTLVLLDTARANRSADIAARPDEFDPQQAHALPHVAFGHGGKYCLGGESCSSRTDRSAERAA